MPDFRAARPHGPLEEIFDGVFVVTGKHGVGPFQATRNMTVLRRGGELTLLNSVRLDADGERALEKLGTVKHLVRLGWFHGIDDPYYVARYAPQFHSGARMVPVNVDASGRTDLVDGRDASFGARVFTFQDGKYDEAAVLIDVDGGVLVTCDSVQHNVDTRGFSLLGGLMMRGVGLVGGVRLGTVWMDKMTDKKPAQLTADFTRLTSLPFRHLLSGHGVPLKNDAREKIQAAMARQLRRR